MTIKSLLFLLFLYICLVWVGAAYLHSDSAADLREFGLRWTAVGLIAVFVFIVGSHLFGWWRRWRSRAAAQPKSAPKPGPVVHEDDAALAALIAEANTALAKAPIYAGKQIAKPLNDLPWYLIIGPEGSGKTSTFLNSGVEPQLLAGQVTRTGPIVSTRICNLWLAKNAIFVEVSGKAFDGDLGRWAQMLRVLRSTDTLPFWRRLWGSAERNLTLRGVIGFCDVREFSGASADPQRFERYCRNWQERLRAIGEVFGVEFPVYQVLTKCDEIPFFRDFFYQLPESEAGQVLGSTFPLHKIDASQPGEVFAEAEAKRLTRTFRLLYHSLAEKRLTHLAHETNPDRRPAIYEFPRELKRIRTHLVQFLTDAFRPDPLRPGPLLRGYYLTAVREVAAAAESPLATPDDWKTLGAPSFRAEAATRMFGAQTFDKSIKSERPKRTSLRWAFVSELFHRVVLADQSLPVAAPVDTRLAPYRQRVFAGVCGFCGLLCLAFFASWLGNLSLLHDVEAAARGPIQKSGVLVTVADLRTLDALRYQVERLRNGAGWWLHWGLYTGNKVKDAARAAYFRRFHQLLLSDLNLEMVNRLKALPVTPDADDRYDPVYRTLKTHLTIADGTCPVEPDFVSQVLKGVRNDIGSKNGSEWQILADRQIDFYARELVYGNPSPVEEDAEARAGARRYLRSVTGVDRIYQGILANAAKTLSKPQRLGDLSPDYAQVLKGPEEVPGVFTVAGWAIVEKASKEHNPSMLGDACVLGEGPEGSSNKKGDADVAEAIQRLFIHDYIDRWQEFLAAFAVLPYSGAQDAARKLDKLSSNRSPLMALFAMTAGQTSFVAEQATGLQQIVKKVENKVGLDPTPKPPEPSTGPGEITRFFQPVHSVVPPGSEKWVVDQNKAYMEALAHLGSSMQEIASSSDPAARQAAGQAANQNSEKALDTVREIARGFKLEGLDITVKRLLEEPIVNARPWFVDAPIDVVKVINAKSQALCKDLQGTLDKYPFKASSAADVSLTELSAAFAPASGEIWKFQKQSLGELTIKEKDGSEWKPKDPAQKPQVTQDMLRFLSRAQQIVTAFYPAGGTQPQLTYALLPKKLDSRFPKDSSLELEIDGKLYQWTSALRKEFTWPAAPGTKTLGANAGIRTGTLTYPFDSRVGLWGIFRIIGAAEPRMLLSNPVEWKYSRVGNGPPREIEPAPVQIDIVEFPGGQDVFNPKFFDGFQCPPRAVQQ